MSMLINCSFSPPVPIFLKYCSNIAEVVFFFYSKVGISKVCIFWIFKHLINIDAKMELRPVDLFYMYP